MNSRLIVSLLLSAVLAYGILLLAGAFGPAVAGEPSCGPGPAAVPPPETKMELKNLTPAEERVILRKGTEAPFTGAYWNAHATGTYTCKRCAAPLFPSAAKFDSGTGWPSFDQALPGAVKEIPDADGMRTEIVCARCGAHLGHVFRGEGFTARDTRHCVNSISLEFAAAGKGDPAGGAAGPAVSASATTSAGTCSVDDGPGQASKATSTPGTAEAFFAGGCFWGVEYFFDGVPGVITAESGYMGGHVDHPTYEEVCSHATGHVETVRVVFDPSKTTYEALAKRFFDIHDPTQVDRQGPDRGEQYRSVVFFADEAQKRTAQALIDRLVRRGYKVATRLEPASTFWPAETYHQDYYAHKRGTPYCHTKVNRFGDE